MAGTVYLGGGGDAQDEAALWKLMLAERPRIAYWPFALAADRLPTAEQWFVDSLQSHHSDLQVTTWTSLDGHEQDELDDVDLIYIGGGNTFHLLDQLKSHGALGWVHHHLDRGGHLYGGSAGAVLAGATIAIATDHNPNTTGLSTPADLEGLGLLPDQVIRPHYTPDILSEAQAWSATHEFEVLGVPETAGLVLADGVVGVVGTDPVWRISANSALPLNAGQTFPISGDQRF